MIAIAASDSVPYARVINEMCDTIRQLGPFTPPKQITPSRKIADDEEVAIEAAVGSTA